MLGPRILASLVVIFALLLGAMEVAAPGHGDRGCPMPFGVQGGQDDCDGCLRAPFGSIACQPACGGIAAASVIAWAAPDPVRGATGVTAVETNHGAPDLGPDPRPPEIRRLT